MIIMEKICLDTDIVLDFLKGTKSTVEKIKHYSEEEVCITTLSMFELLNITNKPEIIRQFTNSVNTLDFNENCSLIASRIVGTLRDQGIMPPIRNIFTASICIDNGAFLVTKDRRDYENIRGLKLV